MIMFKKWAKHKVKSCICCINQFLREKRHKKWSQECKQKQSLLFNFCNIIDLLISRTEKITWWLPVFKPDFFIFSYNEQLRQPPQLPIAKENCLWYYRRRENHRQQIFAVDHLFTTHHEPFYILLNKVFYFI